VFNFEKVPTVVGGPYEYGVPGAVHGLFEAPEEAKTRQPAREAPA
jgi:cytochrome c oxidase subunit I